MELSTSYLGLKLTSPVIIGSSPLTADVKNIVKCAKAGAGAVVLKSIFEEQILSEIKKEEGYTDIYNSFPEASAYLSNFMRGNEIELYVKLIKEAKKAVDIPVIASINCADKGEWISFAKDFQEAGADALELNISISPFDKDRTSKDIEDEYVEIVKAIKKNVRIPISVKIGDHFTNITNMAFRLVEAGADGLVLFNRFYNPDIDINNMKIISGNALSVKEENSNTLRWISLLSAKKIACDLSASTGVHDGKDVVKQILAGAATVQICSTLYHNKIDYVENILTDIKNWMKEHNIDNINCFKGVVNKDEDVKIAERLQYLKRNEG